MRRDSLTTLYRNVRRGEDPALAVLGPQPSSPDHVYGEMSSDGGVTWYRFAGCLPLVRISLAVHDDVAARIIWPMSDYGVMGYDWSAIRDSSSETVAAMERVARRFVPDGEFYARLGISGGQHD